MSELNLDFLKRSFFYFDLPVPYKLQDGNSIEISPVNVKQSEIFLSSQSILDVKKNEMGVVEIIQMSYLQFLCEVLLKDKDNVQRFVNILNMCLGWEKPIIIYENKKPYLLNEGETTKISPNDFEDIRRIILYQNLPDYDDSYMDPELKKNMQLMDKIKAKGVEIPNIERKMAIISAHCGMSKKDQLEMTFRAHSMLFDEVCGEVDFTTIRPIALFGGGADKLDHWIYKKKKGKYDKYITSVDDYAKSMGSNSNAIKSTENFDLNKLLNK